VETGPEIQIEIFTPYIGGLELLGKTLESVRRQTFLNWKLTIVDNSSEGSSVAELIEEIGDSRISSFCVVERQTMVQNWNNCLNASVNDLVILCHSDDEWENNFLHELLEIAAIYPNAAAYFSTGYTINSAGDKVFNLADWYKGHLMRHFSDRFVLQGEKGLRKLSQGNFVFCSTTCFRRLENGFTKFDPRWKFAPDYKLLLELLLDNHQIVGTKLANCRYRRHREQATIAIEKASARFEEESELYRWLAIASNELGMDSVTRTANRSVSLRLNMLYFASKCMLRRHVRKSWHYLRLAFK
jgi:glycosyltransferase involved in cell wall biosynthesis